MDRGRGGFGPEEGHVTLKQDARLLALKWEEGPRAKEHKERSARSWKGNLKRQGEDMSSRAAGGSVAQPTHGTRPSETDFGPPTSRTGEGTCVLFYARSAAAFTAATENEHSISLSITGNLSARTGVLELSLPFWP